MSIRERFDAGEWASVRHVPVDVFVSVAFADGTVEEGELRALFDVLLHVGDIADPLLRDAIGDLVAPNAVMRELQEHQSWDERQVDDWAQDTRRLLKRKLSPAEYQSFFCSVVTLGAMIAGGSRSDAAPGSLEAHVLEIYARVWEVDPRSLAGPYRLDVSHPWATEGSSESSPSLADPRTEAEARPPATAEAQPPGVSARLSTLVTVRDGIALSTHAVLRDPVQLASQLVGRLSGLRGTGIREFVEGAEQDGRRMWLRPLRATLTRPGGPLIATLSGHEKKVRALAVSPDGTQAFSGSEDGTIRQWDLRERRQVSVIQLGTPVLCLAVRPDGQRLLWGDDDGTMGVRGLDMVSDVCRVDTGAGPLLSVDWVGAARALAGGADGSLRIWDLELSEPVLELGGRSPAAVAPDGRSAVSYDASGLLKVWDLESGAEIRTLPGEPEPVVELAYSPDGRTVVSVSQGVEGFDASGAQGVQVLKRWDLSRGQVARVEVDLALAGILEPGMGAIAVERTGRSAIVGSMDGNLYLWSMLGETQPVPLAGHAGQILAVVPGPHGQQALSCGLDRTVRLWDPTRYRLHEASTHEASTPHSVEVNALALRSDARMAITCAMDGVFLWDLDSGHTERLPTVEQVWSVAASPDWRVAACGTHTGHIQFWDVSERTLIDEVGEGAPVMLLAVTAEGRLLAVSMDGSLRFWDFATRSQIGSHPAPPSASPLFGLACDPTGRIGLAGDMTGSVRLWIPQDSSLTDPIGRHPTRVTRAAVTPDGCLGLTGAADGSLKLWDLNGGGLRAHLVGHTASVIAIAVTGDSRMAATTSMDHTLRVWALGRASLHATFTGETAMLGCAITRDGSYVAAGEYGGRVHFLRLELGRWNPGPSCMQAGE